LNKIWYNTEDPDGSRSLNQENVHAEDKRRDAGGGGDVFFRPDAWKIQSERSISSGHQPGEPFNFVPPISNRFP